jgi:hypothetical protein
MPVGSYWRSHALETGDVSHQCDITMKAIYTAIARYLNRKRSVKHQPYEGTHSHCMERHLRALGEDRIVLDVKRWIWKRECGL